MIAPTKLYDKFPTISPAQAADLVIKAMVERPHEINTAARQRRRGRAHAGAEADVPAAQHGLPRVPRLGRRQGRGEGGTRESEQIMLAKIFKGVHW